MQDLHPDDYLPLIRRQIRALRAPDWLYEDLVQESWVGILNARVRYDATKGVPWLAYAAIRVRGAILDYLRHIDPLSRAERRQRGQETLEVSLDAPISSDGQLRPLLELLGDANPEERWVRAIDAARLANAARRLPQRGGQAMRLMLDGCDLHETGRRMGVKQPRVSQIRREAVERLRRRFAAAA